ncbi:fatty-acid peroxygenase [Terrabacter terrae]|uniref:Fatty-acid peroxygenase n=1 Tax=Terrabacter terrae TaxID=318434 RepID=A0ABN2UJA3_9MICO
MWLDQTVDLLRDGYVFTARARRERSSAAAAQRPRYAVTVRLLGRPATVVGGADGVRLFYDSTRMRREGAMPQAIARPLFGRGAVHGLDGEEHRTRKRMFVDALMDRERVDELLELADGLMVEALQEWRRRGGGVVYPTATEVYGRAVIRWAGIEVPPEVEARRADDLAVIVDGFATPVMPYVAAWRRRVVCDRWAAALVRETRSGRRAAPEGSVLARVAAQRGTDGELLDVHTAGVELLNVLRPTVAVARFAAFGAVALAEAPEWRRRLADEVAERGSAVGGPLATAFAHEVRRVYPFVPALAAVATRDTEFERCPIPAGRRVLLDVMATNHDPQEWPEPSTFEPERFLGTGAEWSAPFVPQGGGRPESGHRCPGELVAVGLLALTCARLAELDGRLVRGQDLGWSWGRIPALPRSGVVIAVDAQPSVG